MKRIAAAGPNPAWQKTLFFDEFGCGRINRARRIEQLPSGKGINFCRAAGCLGRAETCLVQFCGGENGVRIDAGLRSEGIAFTSIHTAGSTRCCTTCLDQGSGVMTEVIEPTEAASAAEIEAFLSALAVELKSADGAAFCGTLPTGTDPALYDRAAKLVAKVGIPLLLDGFRGIDGVLASGGRVWLKINADELAELTGVKSTSEALAKLFASLGAPEFAAITDGPRPAWASDGVRLVRYEQAELPGKVVNPIGCGDTASAAFASAALDGVDLFDAFRLALGCSEASALTAYPARFDRDIALALADKITMKEL